MANGKTKRCSGCDKIKPIAEFNRRGLSERRQSNCRACNSQYLKEHYAKNRKYYAAKARRFRLARKRETHTRLLAYFAEHPCVDCGEEDPVVLQFDHVRGSKRAGVGDLFNRGHAWSVIEMEIAKCVVRCSNCHWRRTAQQFGWYAYAEGPDRG